MAMTITELFTKAEAEKQAFIKGDDVRDCSDYDKSWGGIEYFLLLSHPTIGAEMLFRWSYDFRRDRFRWTGHRMRTIGREEVEA